ncbi:DUF4259 domain-containing protein [Streptomyces sp. NPDC046275]|uniref:DUF4259 domain-containing protein n=1 Tax=Streptomyces sp. NPDC046275 TaxID=3157201 RepID=UPI003403D815
MGTWDIGPFDNDTAADFSYTVDEAPEDQRAGVLLTAFHEVTGVGDEYLDADQSVEAIAAAALVAAQCPGGDPVTSSYGPKQPIPPLPDALRPAAVEALDRVLAEPSELLELWEESGEEQEWKAGVLRLRAVLTGSAAQERAGERA